MKPQNLKELEYNQKTEGKFVFCHVFAPFSVRAVNIITDIFVFSCILKWGFDPTYFKHPKSTDMSLESTSKINFDLLVVL